MVYKLNEILYEMGSGIISSIAGFTLAILASHIIASGGEIVSFGGCKNSVFIGIFFGLPFGSLAGIWLADKTYLKKSTYSYPILAITLAASSPLGGTAVLLLLDRAGDFGIFLVPVLMVSISWFNLQIVTTVARSLKWTKRTE
jgi:hypothetical protein